MVKQTTGLIIGKFMPLHRGHELLINFGLQYVDRLFVVVDNIPKEQYKDTHVPGSTRVRWVRSAFPKAEVYYLPRANPQEPHEHPDFWNIWAKSLSKLLPKKPDFLFASEDYGSLLARALKSTFIAVDIDRYTVPIRASEIRSDVYGHWEFLSRAAQQDFIMRICVGGPESTGKSTLAKQLADHFGTIFVPEYARFYIESKNQKTKIPSARYMPTLRDMLHIAKGQLALENALLCGAKRFLISDTDVWATTLWSKWLFQRKCDQKIISLAKKQFYDLYLLTKPDIAWEEDAIRYFPKEDERIRFFKEYETILKQNKCNYVVIGGNGQQRTHSAIHAIEQLIKSKFTFKHFVQKLQE